MITYGPELQGLVACGRGDDAGTRDGKNRQHLVGTVGPLCENPTCIEVPLEALTIKASDHKLVRVRNEAHRCVRAAPGIVTEDAPAADGVPGFEISIVCQG